MGRSSEEINVNVDWYVLNIGRYGEPIVRMDHQYSFGPGVMHYRYGHLPTYHWLCLSPYGYGVPRPCWECFVSYKSVSYSGRALDWKSGHKGTKRGLFRYVKTRLSSLCDYIPNSNDLCWCRPNLRE